MPWKKAISCSSPARATSPARRSAARCCPSAITMRSERPSPARTIMAERLLWTTDELIAATGGELRGAVSVPLTGVSIDSRSVAKGDIFAAIKGDRVDGHDYAHTALKAGAGLAIVARPTEEMAAAGPL